MIILELLSLFPLTLLILIPGLTSEMIKASIVKLFPSSSTRYHNHIKKDPRCSLQSAFSKDLCLPPHVKPIWITKKAVLIKPISDNITLHR